MLTGKLRGGHGLGTGVALASLMLPIITNRTIAPPTRGLRRRRFLPNRYAVEALRIRVGVFTRSTATWDSRTRALTAGALLAAAAVLAGAPAAQSATLVQNYAWQASAATLASSTREETIVEADPRYYQFNPDNGYVTGARVDFSVWGYNTLQAQASNTRPWVMGNQSLYYGNGGAGYSFDLENGTPVSYSWGSQAYPIAGTWFPSHDDVQGTGSFSIGTLKSTVQISSGLYPLYADSTLNLAATLTVNYDNSPANVTAPDELKFNNVLVGSTSTKTLTISNNGGLPTTVTQSGNSFAGYSPTFTPGAGAAAVKVYGHQSTGRQYSFAPTQRGAQLGLTVAYDALNNPFSTYLSGTGVAPVAQLASTEASAGNVRIGTTGTANLVVRNVGDGSLAGTADATKLSAHAPAAFGPYFKLTTAADALINDAGASGTGINTKTFAYAFAPTGHGPASLGLTAHFDNGNPNGSNAAADLAFGISGTGVGPVFHTTDYAPGDTLDFGQAEDPLRFTLLIDNATTDGALGGLTRLNLDAYIEDDRSGAFSIVGRPEPMLDACDVTKVILEFDPARLPAFETITANLVLHTDQNAALGDLAGGQTFTYPLSAQTAPEPTSFGLCVAAAALSTRRRRK